MSDLTCISLFSGAGLGDLAVTAAGFRHLALCEIDDYCQHVLAHYHPGVPIYDDVTTVTAVRLRGDGVLRDGERPTLVFGGPPCFAAGTLVLTRRGYIPIEDVRVGDMVLTHLGRWRPVTFFMATEDVSLRRVQAVGCPGIITTDEHPFYARERGHRWNNERRSLDREFACPDWVQASSLTKDYFLGQVLPAEREDAEGSCDFWWLVGRYLADGWLTYRKSRAANGGPKQPKAVIFSAGAHKAEALARSIAAAGFGATRVVERTAIKFHISSTALHSFLGQFGYYAHGKLLPGFCFALDDQRARALLEGYLSGDGHTEEWHGGTARHATTTSKGLALSIALLAQRVYGVVALVNLKKMPAKTTIEGRVVNQRDFYRVSIYPTTRSSFVEGDYGWKIVRTNESMGRRGTVYNISVSEDESYCADGAIVHNCQPASAAGKRVGEADSRWLWPEFLRVVGETRPVWTVAENPRGISTLDGGRAFRGILRELSRMGYRVGWGTWGAADVGAPHKRQRVFIVGYDPEGGLARANPNRAEWGQDAEGRRHVGHGHDARWAQAAGGPGVDGASAGGARLADANGDVRGWARGAGCGSVGGASGTHQAGEGHPQRDAAQCGGPTGGTGWAVAHPHGAGCQEQCGPEPVRTQQCATQRGGDGRYGWAVAHPKSDGCDQRWPQPEGQQGRSDAAECGGAGVSVGDSPCFSQREQDDEGNALAVGGQAWCISGGTGSGGCGSARADPSCLHGDGGHDNRRCGQQGAREVPEYGDGAGSGGGAEGDWSGPESRVDSATDGCTELVLHPRWPSGRGVPQKDWEAPRLSPLKRPYRRQQLTALGNGIVPRQAYILLKAIADYEPAK